MSDERRARDVLPQLVVRPRLGERLLSRLGRRAWERPNVCVSDRIFKVYRLADPWDPDAKPEEDEPIALGPVSLRLGEGKRQPAPHLRPKEPPAPPSAAASAAAFKPNIPAAPAAPPPPRPDAPKPEAQQSDRPKHPLKPAPQPTGNRFSGEFGGTPERRLVGSLPMRPDRAAPAAPGAPDAPAEAAPTRTVPAVNRGPAAQPAQTSRKPTIMGHNPALAGGPPGPATPPPSAPAAQAAQTSRKPTIMGNNPALAGGPGGGPAVDRRPPAPPPRPAKDRGGRLGLGATTITTASLDEPEIIEMPDPNAPPPEPVEDDTPPPPPRAEPPRRAQMPAMADSLDDLFGFAAQEGRMKFGKGDPKKGG